MTECLYLKATVCVVYLLSIACITIAHMFNKARYMLFYEDMGLTLAKARAFVLSQNLCSALNLQEDKKIAASVHARPYTHGK